MDPRVSVLLPVRNGGSWLQAGLESLARQTLTDFEVVAVDDGSTDDSARILLRWAARDRRVRLIRQPASGLVSALNNGLADCRAPLVARMDADDICHPRRLELQVEHLGARPDAGVVSCLVQHFPRREVREGFRLYEEWLNRLSTHDDMARERFIESPVAHPSVMVRTDILRDTGGWWDVEWPEDYDLWLRLFESGVVFAKIERTLLFWREHGSRLTRNDPRYSTAAFLRCKAHHLARGPLTGVSNIVLWGAGRTGRRISKYLLAEAVPIGAVVDIDPAKIGGTLRGIPVISPDELPSHLGGDAVILAAVASRGARNLIRAELVKLRLVEGDRFWCVS